MFDFKVHDNNVTPIQMPTTTCAYCHTVFESRSALFYHLGFMNIDITHKQNTSASMDQDESNVIECTYEAGEFGFVKSKRRAYKLLHLHKKITKQCAQKKHQMKKISDMLSKISLDNLK